MRKGLWPCVGIGIQVAVMLLASATFGQGADAPSPPIAPIAPTVHFTLAEAQSKLFEKNFDLAVAALEKEKAETQWKESRAGLWPSLDASGQYTVLSEKNHIEFELPFPPPGTTLERDLGSHERWETGLDLTYPLFTGFARTRQIEARRYMVEAQDSRHAALRNQFSLRLASLHFAWRMAATSLAYQDAQCALTKAQLTSAENQKQQGLQSERAVLAARSKWLAAENDRLVAVQQVDSLQWEAGQLLGGEEEWLWSKQSSSGKLPDSLVAASKPADAKMDVDTDGNLRPELQSLSHQKASLRATEKALSGQHWPTLAAMAGLRYANPGLNLAGTEPMGYGLAGLQLKWNLFDGGRQRSQRQELRQRQEQVDLEMAKWKTEWRKSETLAARQYRRWKSQAEVADAALESAERSHADARRSLSQGVLTPLDTLESFAQAARARMLKEQSQAMQNLTYCQWLYARGETLDFKAGDTFHLQAQ